MQTLSSWDSKAKTYYEENEIVRRKKTMFNCVQKTIYHKTQNKSIMPTLVWRGEQKLSVLIDRNPLHINQLRHEVKLQVGRMFKHY